MVAGAAGRDKARQHGQGEVPAPAGTGQDGGGGVRGGGRVATQVYEGGSGGGSRARPRGGLPGSSQRTASVPARAVVRKQGSDLAPYGVNSAGRAAGGLCNGAEASAERGSGTGSLGGDLRGGELHWYQGESCRLPQQVGGGVKDQHLLGSASEWRPAAGAMTEGVCKIRVWAKMVKAFLGLLGEGGGNNVPAAGPPPPENNVVGDAPRAADEPPVTVLAGPAPPAGAGLQPLEPAPEPPARREQQNRWWTIVVGALVKLKLNIGGLLVLVVSLVVFLPKLSAAGLVLLTKELLKSLTHVLSQVTERLTQVLYLAGVEALRALAIAMDALLVTLTQVVGSTDAQTTPWASSPVPPRAPPNPPFGWVPWLRGCFVGIAAALTIWTLLLLRHRTAHGGGVGG